MTTIPEFVIPIGLIETKREIGDNVIADIELSSGENPLYEKIFDADDGFRKLNLHSFARWYTSDKEFIKEMQNVISRELPEVSEYKDAMKTREDIRDEEYQEEFLEKYSYVEWDKLQFLNKNSQAMQYLSLYNITSPVLTLALPIFMLIIPFFLIRLQGHAVTWEMYCQYLKMVLKNHSIGQIFSIGSASWDKRVMILMSFAIYLVQVYFNFQSCVKFIKNMRNLHQMIFSYRHYLREASTSLQFTITEWEDLEMHRGFIDRCGVVKNKCDTIVNQLQDISPCSITISKVMDIGKAVKAFYMINMDIEYKATLEYCLKYSSYISTLHSIKSKIESGEMNICNIDKKTKMTGVYYPHLKDSAVKNDIDCNINNIVTGPNAAGKTTMVKSVIINVILSQQFGCGFYESCKLNPYDQIHSYINIPDTSGRDSLFQAEAGRCKHILSSISDNPDDNVLCVFDELFSGTNPYEAISAANAYLKHICSLDNVTFLLTTHFLDLCKKLNKLKNVKNKQMQVVSNNGDFEYTYKVIDGISRVKGGIKVLRDLGYPQHIVDDSSKIIKTLKI